MPAEIVKWVGEIHPSTIIEGTYGGGGHTRPLLEALSQPLAEGAEPANTHPSLGCYGVGACRAR